MVKLYPPILQNLDLLKYWQIAQHPQVSVSYTPFGPVDRAGTVYLKTAPVLKGKKLKEQPAALAEFNPKGKPWPPGVTTVRHPTKGLILLPVSAARLFHMRKRPREKVHKWVPQTAFPEARKIKPEEVAVPPRRRRAAAGGGGGGGGGGGEMGGEALTVGF
jgi:hypothetical protein